MKKLFGIVILSGALLACNDTDGDGSRDINIHVDVDSLGNKIEKKMDKLGDSIEAKTKRLNRKIDEKLDSAKFKL